MRGQDRLERGCDRRGSVAGLKFLLEVGDFGKSLRLVSLLPLK